MQMFEHKQKQILVGSEGSVEQQRYYAFPSMLELKGAVTRILIAYKNGEKHFREACAPLETVTLDAVTKQVSVQRIVDAGEGKVNQNPELMRMPDGSIHMYVDVQQGGSKERLGLRLYRSVDEGETFADEGDFPEIGGCKYGYSFDDATGPDGSVCMLVMSFVELTGGIRAVHAVRTADSGQTWTYLKNLNTEFQFDFNESTLLPYKEGFVLIARGYDKKTMAFRTDWQFNMTASAVLSDRYDSIDYVGRPKLFERDGETYLLCRNIPAGQSRGTLELYRFDPDSLELRSNVLLDANDNEAGDSYYPEPYFVSENGRTMFNVITYAPNETGHKPDIVRLEYDWDELRRLLGDMAYVDG
jgi:hypothetical protein